MSRVKLRHEHGHAYPVRIAHVPKKIVYAGIDGQGRMHMYEIVLYERKKKKLTQWENINLRYT